MWYLGKIKGVELELLCLLKGHDLDVEGPGWVVAIGDGVEQISNGIIWVGGSQTVCLLDWQILYSLIGLKNMHIGHDICNYEAMTKSKQMDLQS